MNLKQRLEKKIDEIVANNNKRLISDLEGVLLSEEFIKSENERIYSLHINYKGINRLLKVHIQNEYNISIFDDDIATAIYINFRIEGKVTLLYVKGFRKDDFEENVKDFLQFLETADKEASFIDGFMSINLK